MSKGQKSQPERTANGQCWTDIGNKINNALLDYNPNYKISICKSNYIKNQSNN